MSDLTVITTTYNRCKQLRTAYESLCHQGSVDFIWLIIDDGSTDETRDQVNQWKEEGLVKIKYVYQENGGVTLARHIGRMLVNTYWMTILDSDDYYIEGALETIQNILETINIKDDKNCMGLLFPVLNDMTTNVREGNYSLTQQYYKYGCSGEFQLIVKTDEWNRFQPPRFIGEKFVTESVYLRQIDKFYYFKCINIRFMVREYHSDGLTNNIANIIRDNPKGQAYAMKVDCVFGESLGFFKRVQAYIDFRNFSRNRLNEKSELYPELQVPALIKICADFYSNHFWIKYVRSIIQYPFPKKKIRRYSSIILWGAGNMGKALKLYVDKSKYCNIILWCDSNYEVKRGEGLGVANPEILFSIKNYDYILIAIQSPNVGKDVEKYLIKKHIDEKKIVRMA